VVIFLLAVLWSVGLLFSQELPVVELENNTRMAEERGNAAARSIASQYWQLADLYMNDKNYAKAYENARLQITIMIRIV
jgi:hypothetical protein